MEGNQKINAKELIEQALNEYQRELGIGATKRTFQFISNLEEKGIKGMSDEDIDLIYRAMGLMLYKYGQEAAVFLLLSELISNIITERQNDTITENAEIKEETKEVEK